CDAAPWLSLAAGRSLPDRPVPAWGRPWGNGCATRPDGGGDGLPDPGGRCTRDRASRRLRAEGRARRCPGLRLPLVLGACPGDAADDDDTGRRAVAAGMAAVPGRAPRGPAAPAAAPGLLGAARLSRWPFPARSPIPVGA